MCAVSHPYVTSLIHMCVTWLIHTRAMTHPYVCNVTTSCVWRGSFLRWTWLIHVCDMCVTWLIHTCTVTHPHVCNVTTSCVWRDSFIRWTWLIHVCAMSPSYVRHDSFIGVKWLIYMYDMTHLHVWHDASARVYSANLSAVHNVKWSPWRIHMCYPTHRCVCHDSWTFVTWRIRASIFCKAKCSTSNKAHDSFICVTWLIYMCAMTHPTARVHPATQSALRNVTWSPWLTHMCYVTHSCVPCVPQQIHRASIFWEWYDADVSI